MKSSVWRREEEYDRGLTREEVRPSVSQWRSSSQRVLKRFRNYTRPRDTPWDKEFQITFPSGTEKSREMTEEHRFFQLLGVTVGLSRKAG